MECMAAHNAYLLPDPVAADFTRVRVVVHVNWQTVRDSTTGEETRFWHSPLECSVTRRDYRDNPDVLFALLSKALPNAEWAGWKWMRGHVERVSPLVWPVPGSVEPDQARVEMREIVRVMLFLDEQDLPLAPVDRCVHSFWLYRI
jgi:hypothetical protein